MTAVVVCVRQRLTDIDSTSYGKEGKGKEKEYIDEMTTLSFFNPLPYVLTPLLTLLFKCLLSLVPGENLLK